MGSFCALRPKGLRDGEPTIKTKKIAVLEGVGNWGQRGKSSIGESLIKQEKGTQTQIFWSRYLLVGGGLPRQGVGAKKFGMSLEPQGNQRWDIPGFCRDIPGAPETFEKKKLVFNSLPRCKGRMKRGNRTESF